MHESQNATWVAIRGGKLITVETPARWDVTPPAISRTPVFHLDSLAFFQVCGTELPSTPAINALIVALSEEDEFLDNRN